MHDNEQLPVQYGGYSFPDRITFQQTESSSKISRISAPHKAPGIVKLGIGTWEAFAGLLVVNVSKLL